MSLEDRNQTKRRLTFDFLREGRRGKNEYKKLFLSLVTGHLSLVTCHIPATGKKAKFRRTDREIQAGGYCNACNAL